jgi:hypothetical protein
MRAWDQKHFLGRAALSAAIGFCCLMGLSERAVATELPARVVTHFTIADFDGDNRPDLASVRVGQIGSDTTRYWIAFHLSSGAGQTVGLTAPTGGLQIASRDVNGDSFPDVIVTTAGTNKPVAILLNDGFGNFTASDASEFQSSFISSEQSWSVAADETGHVAAIALSRVSPSDGAAKSRALLPIVTSRLLAVRSTSPQVPALVSPFRGRAPPCR